MRRHCSHQDNYQLHCVLAKRVHGWSKRASHIKCKHVLTTKVKRKLLTTNVKQASGVNQPHFQNLSLAGVDRSQHDTQTRTNRRIFEDCSNKRKRNERDNMKKNLGAEQLLQQLHPLLQSFLLLFLAGVDRSQHNVDK